MASGVIRAEFPDWRPVIANIPNSRRGLARFKYRVTVWNPVFLKQLRTHDETGRLFMTHSRYGISEIMS
jgi:hypothetical protein